MASVEVIRRKPSGPPPVEEVVLRLSPEETVELRNFLGDCSLSSLLYNGVFRALIDQNIDYDRGRTVELLHQHAGR